MYRGSYSNRGARRGGRGGNRGGFRSASHGNRNRNLPSVANSSGTSIFEGPQLPKAALIGGGHFNPSATGYDRSRMSTINSGEEKPDGVSFAIVHVQTQPQWMDKNIIYVKSNLHLLPEYAEKKSLLLENHKEMGQEELMDRTTAELTQSIKFNRYGVEDGPDVEIFDSEGQISSLILPGDWMSVSHEPPLFASVDTPSIKYTPVFVDPLAVFAGYRNDSNSTGFKFVAWFLIEEIELFAANSLDLARKMHDKKWSSDIGHEWAAVKLMRVEKGDPEWRPAPDIRRRPAASQASDATKAADVVLELSTEAVVEILASVTAMIEFEHKDTGPVQDGDRVDGAETAQPLDEVQEHKSESKEGGSDDAAKEAVPDIGADTDSGGDVVHTAVDNDAGVDNEIKTEVVKVEDHVEDTKGGSAKELEDGDGGTDKEAIPETDNGGAKATDHHGESVLSIQLKDKQALVEKGEKLVEDAKVEVDDSVTPTGVSEETADRELVVGKMKEDEVAVKIPTTAGEGREAKEEKEEVKEEKEEAMDEKEDKGQGEEKI
ncbi:hypothetical protein F5144DRAFT_641677 [Chaetomium tenue]|uniref:Uncharacterized protein n=1 Tax=Chaetomium tenue TaxID=1854479 RepID=A0ACB7PJ11_9PEZI|nr:hypothetical protein F5144DRAFT_641677 [Chaetomium globosum]